MAGVNEFGFVKPDSYQDRRIGEKVSSLPIPHNARLEDETLNRLASLGAYWLLDTGQHRQVLSDCIGREARFHEKIRESYGGTWEAVKAGPLAETTRRALDAELRSIQFDLREARIASEMYSADQPWSRHGLQVLSGMASEAFHHINRYAAHRAFTVVEPVKLERGEKAETLIASLAEAKFKRKALELCIPPEDEAWFDIQSELATRCKMPSVQISPRVTPDEIFRRTNRLLPPTMDIRTVWPTRDSRHAIAPGQALNLNQIDSLGVLLALHKDEIAAHLKAELSRRYEAAKIDGILIMTAQEQRQALSELAADTLLTERKLSRLFWDELDGKKRVPGWMTSAELISPPALLGIH